KKIKKGKVLLPGKIILPFGREIRKADSPVYPFTSGERISFSIRQAGIEHVVYPGIKVSPCIIPLSRIGVLMWRSQHFYRVAGRTCRESEVIIHIPGIVQ